VKGYAVNVASAMGAYDWRLAEGNIWKVERMLLEFPHRRIQSSDARVKQLRERYARYRARFGHKPLYYRRRDRWTPLPEEFRYEG
jgi:hypothetical protein